LARNYHAIVEKMAEMMARNFSEAEESTEDMPTLNAKRPEVQDYGMTGEVKLITYTIKDLV
jgi:hypothetical protein